MNEQKGGFKDLYKNLITPLLKKDSGIDAEYLTNLSLSLLSFSSRKYNWTVVSSILKSLNKEFSVVDKIATNYSKGISLISNLKESESSVDFFEKNAPSEIQELFSRNELIQKFADKKYLLSSLELSNLLGEEKNLKIKKYSLFEWRNWRLIPKDKKYWIIEKKEA